MSKQESPQNIAPSLFDGSDAQDNTSGFSTNSDESRDEISVSANKSKAKKPVTKNKTEGSLAADSRPGNLPIEESPSSKRLRESGSTQATSQPSNSALRGSTPLMRQYFGIKEKHPNTVLLFRMGDFYETFDDDARLVAPILGLTLTKRANGKAATVALAGFPHHSLDSYLPKLVRAGYRVAICEQVEDPKAAKGIVKREVREVVTPGVSFRDELLNPRRANYLAASCPDKNGRTGIAFIDASTGEFFATQVETIDVDRVLGGIGPTELLVPESAAV